MYIFNDWVDRETDRQHPEKKTRPIASREVSGTVAAILGAALLSAAFGLLAALTNSTVVWLAAGYATLSAAYSLGLKQVVILDAFAVAGGFVIRVWAGAFAVGVERSPWKWAAYDRSGHEITSGEVVPGS